MKNRISLFIIAFYFIFLIPFLSKGHDPAISFHKRQNKIVLNPDLTGTHLIHVEIDILTPEGIELTTQIPIDYDPQMRTLTLKEAFVLQPDGSKISLPKENIFTRPSANSQAAPGFSNNVTTTLLFPQLIVGSRLIFTFESHIKDFGPWGFFWEMKPEFSFPTDFMETIIEAPPKKDFFLDAAEVRGFPFEECEDPQTHKRIFKATLQKVPAHEKESFMISPEDLVPSFYASTLQDWTDCGRIYAEQSEKLLEITPEIQKLSNKIVGTSKGREAAEKIYNWVAQNITYIAVLKSPKFCENLKGILST